MHCCTWSISHKIRGLAQLTREAGWLCWAQHTCIIHNHILGAQALQQSMLFVQCCMASVTIMTVVTICNPIYRFLLMHR